jgi:hypothetical protein
VLGVQGLFVIGQLNGGNPAVGDSLVLSTSTVSPTLANQTVDAGALIVQGPSGDHRISKLSADASQVLHIVGATSITGGSGIDAFAIVDPTNQSITSGGPITLQGGTGPNADAIINATGPQSVVSLNGPITLRGGSGRGADALIETTSPFQNVHGANGASPILIDTIGGGIAGLTHGSDSSGASTLAANNLTNELLREQNRLNEILSDAERADEEDRKTRRSNQVCR